MVRPAISSVIRCIVSAQIYSCAAHRLQLCDRFVRHRDHVRNEPLHRARGKGRRQRSPLVLPGAALGDQQAFAKHRAQHPDAGGRPRIVLVIIDQHMPDRIRRVEDKAGAPEEAALDDVLFIGALAPGSDRALAHRRQPPQRGHGFGRAWRMRGDQRLTRGRDVPGFGYAHERPRKIHNGIGMISSYQVRNPGAMKAREPRTA